MLFLTEVGVKPSEAALEPSITALDVSTGAKLSVCHWNKV